MGLEVQAIPAVPFISGVGAVAAGTPVGGWVSGQIASLALSASVNTVFDLGANWLAYQSVAIIVSAVGPSSGLTAVQVFGSDTVAVDASRRLADRKAATFGALNAAITVAGGVVEAEVRPAGRYLIVSATNADGVSALGATSKITIRPFVS